MFGAHIKEFFHKHPIESAVLAGVGIIGLYLALKPNGNAAANQQAQLQSAYFAAESIQAQSGAAIQVANIQAGRDTALATIAADVSKTNATTYANLDQAINASNNSTAVAALPYAQESHIIDALSSISNQTTTTSKSSSGFFGIGAGSKTTTAPTPQATSAASYLEELINGHYASNG